MTLNIMEGQPNFRWQMVFNAFVLERVGNGCLARIAYVTQNSAAEIVPILICNQGIEQLRESSQSYLQDFGAVPPRQPDQLPQARQFSPLFSNHVRLARSGDSAEIAFFTVPLHHIASVAKVGQAANNLVVQPVQVALLHSDILTHQQFVLGVLSI